LKNFPEALADFTKVVKLCPDNVKAFFKLGVIYFQASVNSRPMYTSHSRIDGYHQNECGGG